MKAQPAVPHRTTSSLSSSLLQSGNTDSVLTLIHQDDPSFRNGIQMLTFKRGDVVASSTCLTENMYILTDGEINLVCMNDNNRRLVAAVLAPGAVFGEGALAAKLHSHIFAEARSDVTLWRITNSDARDMTVQYPILSWALLQTYGERLAQVEDSLEDIAYKTLPERLAQLLLDYSNHEAGIITGISHQYLADHLGTYRETVSAILRDFKRQNLVELGYRRIKILDAETLSDLAGILDW